RAASGRRDPLPWATSRPRTPGQGREETRPRIPPRAAAAAELAGAIVASAPSGRIARREAQALTAVQATREPRAPASAARPPNDREGRDRATAQDRIRTATARIGARRAAT